MLRCHVFYVLKMNPSYMHYRVKVVLSDKAMPDIGHLIGPIFMHTHEASEMEQQLDYMGGALVMLIHNSLTSPVKD